MKFFCNDDFSKLIIFTVSVSFLWSQLDNADRNISSATISKRPIDIAETCGNKMDSLDVSHDEKKVDWVRRKSFSATI